MMLEAIEKVVPRSKTINYFSFINSDQTFRLTVFIENLLHLMVHLICFRGVKILNLISVYMRNHLLIRG